MGAVKGAFADNSDEDTAPAGVVGGVFTDQPWDQPAVAQKPAFATDAKGTILTKDDLVSASRDTTGSVIAGVGNLVSTGGELYGLVTGDMSKGQPTYDFGQKIRGIGREVETPEYVARSDQAQRAISDAGKNQHGLKGVFAEGVQSLAEMKKSPVLATGLLLEQVPNFAAAVATGGATEGISLGLGATEATAAKIGAGTAITAAAAQQGGDVGEQTYQTLKSMPQGTLEKSQAYRDRVAQGMTPDQAREDIANSLARVTALEGGGISLLTMKALPGAEKMAFRQGLGKGVVGGAVKGIVGEGLQEGLEEGGGQFVSNLAVKSVDPNQSLSEGVGSNAAQGALVGSLLGGATGAVHHADSHEAVGEPHPPEADAYNVGEPTPPAAEDFTDETSAHHADAMGEVAHTPVVEQQPVAPPVEQGAQPEAPNPEAQPVPGESVLARLRNAAAVEGKPAKTDAYAAGLAAKVERGLKSGQIDGLRTYLAEQHNDLETSKASPAQYGRKAAMLTEAMNVVNEASPPLTRDQALERVMSHPETQAPMDDFVTELRRHGIEDHTIYPQEQQRLATWQPPAPEVQAQPATPSTVNVAAAPVAEAPIAKATKQLKDLQKGKTKLAATETGLKMVPVEKAAPAVQAPQKPVEAVQPAPVQPQAEVAQEAPAAPPAPEPALPEGVRVSKGPDFSFDGMYRVHDGGRDIGGIFRNPADRAWYSESGTQPNAKLEDSKLPLGYTRNEAAAKLVSRHRAQAPTPIRFSTPEDTFTNAYATATKTYAEKKGLSDAFMQGVRVQSGQEEAPVDMYQKGEAVQTAYRQGRAYWKDHAPENAAPKAAPQTMPKAEAIKQAVQARKAAYAEFADRLEEHRDNLSNATYQRLKREAKTQKTPVADLHSTLDRTMGVDRRISQRRGNRVEAPASDYDRPAHERVRQLQVQHQVEAIVAQWSNAPHVIVTPTYLDLPEEIRLKLQEDGYSGDWIDIRGLHYRDTAYIFSAFNPSPETVTATVYHEALGHYGMQELFGDRIDRTLEDMYRTNPMVRAQADAWMQARGENDHLTALHEIFAEASERGRFGATALAKLKAVIREVGRRMGLRIGYSDEDVGAILAMAHDVVVKNGITMATGKTYSPRTSQSKALAGMTDNQRYLADEKIAPREGPLAERIARGERETFEQHVGPGGKETFVHQHNLADLLPPDHNGTVYHQTTMANALGIVRRTLEGPRRHDGIYVSPDRDLALGQKGSAVTLEFDATKVNGFRPQSLQNETMNGTFGRDAELKIDKTVRDAVSAINVSTKGQLERLAATPWIASRFDVANAQPEGKGFRVARKGTQTQVRPSVADATADLGNQLREQLENAKADPTGAVRRFVQRGLTMNQLVEQYGKDIPSLPGYYRNLQEAGARAHQHTQAAYDLLNRWQGLKTDRKAVGDLLNDATFNQVDPRYGEDEGPNKSLSDEQKAAYAKARAAYQAMTPAGRHVFNDVLNHYKENLNKSMELFNSAIDNAESMTPSQKAEAKRETTRFFKKIRVYFPLMRFGKFIAVGRSQALVDAEAKLQSAEDTLAKVRDVGSDEDIKAAEEDVSEARKDADAEREKGGYIVSAFESSGERNRVAEAWRKTGMDVRLKNAGDYEPKIDGVSHDFMQKIEGSLEPYLHNADTKDLAEGMRGLMRQMYFQSLPENAALKRNLKRKGVPGFHRNAERVFAASSIRDAHYLSKLEFGQNTRELLSQMGREVNDAPENVQDAYNVVRAQHAIALNFHRTPLQEAAANVVYTYYLGFSPAFAATNLAQTLLVTAPMVSARHGWTRTGAALTSAFKQTTQAQLVAFGKDGWQGEIDFNKLTARPDEQAMLRTLLDRGVIDLTQGHDLGTVASNQSREWRAFMKAASFLPHYTEKLNRITSALAAYRLELPRAHTSEAAYADYAKSYDSRYLDKDGNLAPDAPVKLTPQQYAATEYALKIVEDSHFNYSTENAPYWFKRIPGSKLIFQFKKYQQAMMYGVVKNAVAAFKGEDVETRRVARNTLAGQLAMQAVTTGVLGLPGAAAIMAAVDLLAMAFQDPDDPYPGTQYVLRDWLAKMFGKRGGLAVAKGAPAAAGVDLSGRLGLGDLFNPIRVRNTGDEGRDAWNNLMASALGPAVSLGGDFAESYKYFHQGDVAKGWEYATPKFMRDIIRSVRFGTEGVTTSKGTQVVAPDKIKPAELWLQALGLTPTRLNEHYAAQQAEEGLKDKLDFRSRMLVRRYAEAVLNDDMDRATELRQDVLDYNMAQIREGRPIIKNSTLFKAIRSRRVDRAKQSGARPLTAKERAMQQVSTFADDFDADENGGADTDNDE